MQAHELMRTDIVTIQEDASVSQLCDALQVAHVNGLPVLNEDGDLVGIVTEEDVLYGTMGAGDGAGDMRVRDIMTSPAVCATGDTDVIELCKMMWGMRIHHVPILVEGKVKGVVSALDIVRTVSEGDLGS